VIVSPVSTGVSSASMNRDVRKNEGKCPENATTVSHFSLHVFQHGIFFQVLYEIKTNLTSYL
jgi:hypothetical protein